MTDFGYVPLFTESYGSDVEAAEAVATTEANRVTAELAKLTRPDGTAVYGPAEQQERAAAITEAAAARYDAAVRRSVEKAEREIADLERSLTLLAGSDPLDSLKPDEQARAASRREFVREDCESLPAQELAQRMRAAVVAVDKPLLALYARYVPTRGDSGGDSLRGAMDELSKALGLDERHGKRREAEKKLRAARTLPVAIDSARRRIDGRADQLMAQARQRVVAGF